VMCAAVLKLNIDPSSKRCCWGWDSVCLV